MKILSNLTRFLEQRGKAEFVDEVKRQISQIESIAFNEASYLAANPDLAQNLPNNTRACAYQHWVENGRREGRNGSGLSRYQQRDFALRPKSPTDKLKILFFGPLSAASGLGCAARGYAAALDNPDWTVEAIDSTACLYLHREKKPIAAPRMKPDIVIIHHNPDALHNFFLLVDRSVLDGAYVIGAWVWELPALNPLWAEHFVAFDEIWAPTQFVADAVSAQAPATVKVNVVPYVVQPPASGTYARAYFGIPDDCFVFLCVFDVSSVIRRKNPRAALEAFTKAFGDDTSAVLVMKYHSSGADVERVKALRREFDRSNIIFLDGLFSEDENAGLKAVCDCVVSPHSSEGFGLNIAEAMLLDRLTIVTGYSGNVDFCNETTSLLIRHALVEVGDGSPPYSPGAVWAEADVDHLASLMREAMAGGDRMDAIRAAARAHVARVLSLGAVQALVRASVTSAVASCGEAGFRRDKKAELLYGWTHPLGNIVCPDYCDAIAALSAPVTISVIVPVYNIDADILRECVESVLQQTYPFWELCICDDNSTNPATKRYIASLRGLDTRIKIIENHVNRGISASSNAAVELALGDYVAFLDHDDVIHEDALLEFAQAITQNNYPDLLYCDEDKIDFDGSHVDHYYKPSWSPEHLESCMYVLHMLVARKSAFLRLGGYRDQYTGAQDYDFALRISRAKGRVVHVPKLLYHWRKVEGSASAVVDAKPQALDNARAALVDYAAAKYGADAYVESGRLPGLYRLRRGKRLAPPVTLVMTTNDVSKIVEGRGEINLPAHFIESILSKTDYPNYRILVSSNGALSERARRLLGEAGGEEVHYVSPTTSFNFADKANFSIRQAATDIVVLLNDDMEVISADWLRALVDLILNPDVGAVGGRLLFPNDQIQHVGIALGVNGGAAHLYHRHPAAIVGYNGYPNLIRNYSAVTGACMATRRSVFDEAGGFDTCFAIDFNDTDYCLKLLERGYRVAYTPFCELYHFESQTAARREQNPQELSAFRARWRKYLERDPYFNPNLSRTSITFDAATS